MTINKELNKMTPEELGKLFPIILVESNPEWTNIFNREKNKIEKAFPPDSIFRIEHFGSTAIPGLISKPSIDILLEIQTAVENKTVIDILKNQSYHYLHKPENPPPHMLFVKGYSTEGFRGQAFHIHVRYPGDWDEIHFRDYLMQHPQIRQEYTHLKKKLSIDFQNDREGYTEGKTEFVEKITKLARRQNEGNSRK